MQREIVILPSSSPLANAHRHVSTTAVSPSQDNAELNALFGLPRLTPAGLRSGSLVSAIPENGALGFQSALSLLPDEAEPPIAQESIPKEKSAKKAKAPAKPRTKKAKESSTAQLTADAPIKKKVGRPRKDPNAPPKVKKSRVKTVKTAAAATDGKENEVIQQGDAIANSAYKRRKSWTPTKDSAEKCETNAQTFASIKVKLSEFVYTDEQSASTDIPEAALLKRKRSGLADEIKRLKKISPTKKSPVKKAKTITALALEKYNAQNGSVEPAAEIQPTRKSKAAKQATAVAPLLSPLSAADKLLKQNVQFGTSSQLAGVTSPTYLRQLHRALKESAALNPPAFVPSVNRKYRSANTTSTGGMWGAGALHSDDGVLEMSKIEDEFKDIDAFVQTSPIPEVVEEHDPLDHDENVLLEDELAIPSSFERPEDLILQPLTSTSLKKPRGRPRKDTAPNIVSASAALTVKVVETTKPASSSEFLDIDEIQDSDEDAKLTPSPPRIIQASRLPLTGDPVSKAKKALKSTAAVKAANKYGSRPDWEVIKGPLFESITDAVLSTPPSEVRGQPTWQEKMLMFEPIVLEDFTEWLVEQGISIKEGEGPGKTLLPWMVQKWCETKSICCLWKLNNRRQRRG